MSLGISVLLNFCLLALGTLLCLAFYWSTGRAKAHTHTTKSNRKKCWNMQRQHLVFLVSCFLVLGSLDEYGCTKRCLGIPFFVCLFICRVDFAGGGKSLIHNLQLEPKLFNYWVFDWSSSSWTFHEIKVSRQFGFASNQWFSPWCFQFNLGARALHARANTFFNRQTVAIARFRC